MPSVVISSFFCCSAHHQTIAVASHSCFFVSRNPLCFQRSLLRGSFVKPAPDSPIRRSVKWIGLKSYSGLFLFHLLIPHNSAVEACWSGGSAACCRHCSHGLTKPLLFVFPLIHMLEHFLALRPGCQMSEKNFSVDFVLSAASLPRCSSILQFSVCV